MKRSDVFHHPRGESRLRRNVSAFLLAASASLAAGSVVAQPIQAVLDRLEAAPIPPSSPAEARDQWCLAFIDVETTGLLPGYHEMIDAGIVLTDLEGNEVDRLFLRVQPEHPERTSPGAVAVNAFDPERWKSLGAKTAAEAVDEIVAFHERTAKGRPTLLVAFNSQFDTAFLDYLFRSRGRTWRELYHYFVLDIPSMAWSLGLRQLDGASLSRELAVEDEPHVAEDHTGITGAALNARIYRALLARRDELRTTKN